MSLLLAAFSNGIHLAQGLELLNIEADLWNRDSADCGAGEVMAFNEDGANTTYIGMNPRDSTTWKYGSVFKITTANIIGACAMALETVRAGKRGRYLICGMTDKLKIATVSGSISAGHGYELTAETTATGSSAAVSNVASSAGSSLVARPATGTNGLDAYTVPLRGYGKLQQAAVDTSVAARQAYFNGLGYWLGYGA